MYTCCVLPFKAVVMNLHLFEVMSQERVNIRTIEMLQYNLNVFCFFFVLFVCHDDHYYMVILHYNQVGTLVSLHFNL